MPDPAPEEAFDFGLPKSLLQNWPGLHFRRWTLRLGDIPLLAEHSPDLMERSVPIRQVEWAAGILSREHGEAPAAPSRLADNTSASTALDDAQAAVSDAMALAIPTGSSGEEEGESPSGLGWWLHLYHFALTGLHLGRSEALNTPVGELFALSAVHAVTLGATFKAPTYSERDMLDDLPTPDAMQKKT